jgi:hypothetical protein
VGAAGDYAAAWRLRERRGVASLLQTSPHARTLLHWRPDNPNPSLDATDDTSLTVGLNASFAWVRACLGEFADERNFRACDSVPLLSTSLLLFHRMWRLRLGALGPCARGVSLA